MPEISTKRDTVQAITQWHRIMWGTSCIPRYAHDQVVFIRVSLLTARNVVQYDWRPKLEGGNESDHGRKKAL